MRLRSCLLGAGWRWRERPACRGSAQAEERQDGNDDDDETDEIDDTVHGMTPTGDAGRRLHRTIGSMMWKRRESANGSVMTAAILPSLPSRGSFSSKLGARLARLGSPSYIPPSLGGIGR